MKPGRPSNPSEFEGTPGNRQAEQSGSTMPAFGEPRKPHWHGKDEIATHTWDTCVEGMRLAGTLSALDAPALSIYAFNTSRAEKLSKFLDPDYPGCDSRERGRLAREYKDAASIVGTYGDKYGFNALSRKKIGSSQPSGQVKDVPDGQTHGESVIGQLTGNA